MTSSLPSWAVVCARCRGYVGGEVAIRVLFCRLLLLSRPWVFEVREQVDYAMYGKARIAEAKGVCRWFGCLQVDNCTAPTSPQTETNLGTDVVLKQNKRFVRCVIRRPTVLPLDQRLDNHLHTLLSTLTFI
jgi:hypothetical protein